MDSSVLSRSAADGTFWVAGKNNIADKFANDQNMKQAIADLRDGWYGNQHSISSEDSVDESVQSFVTMRLSKHQVDFTL